MAHPGTNLLLLSALLLAACGGGGQSAVDGDDPVAVEEKSWGGIKSLYR